MASAVVKMIATHGVRRAGVHPAERARGTMPSRAMP